VVLRLRPDISDGWRPATRHPSVPQPAARPPPPTMTPTTGDGTVEVPIHNVAPDLGDVAFNDVRANDQTTAPLQQLSILERPTNCRNVSSGGCRSWLRAKEVHGVFSDAKEIHTFIVIDISNGNSSRSLLRFYSRHCDYCFIVFA
jgi:hypothetical protein